MLTAAARKLPLTWGRELTPTGRWKVFSLDLVQSNPIFHECGSVFSSLAPFEAGISESRAMSVKLSILLSSKKVSSFYVKVEYGQDQDNSLTSS